MIRIERKLNSTDVLDALTALLIQCGPPRLIRPDNGPEFIAPKVRDDRRQERSYRTWLSVGERLLRVIVRQVPGRVVARLTCL